MNKLLKILIILGIIVSVMGIVWIGRGWYMSWENNPQPRMDYTGPLDDYLK